MPVVMGAVVAMEPMVAMVMAAAAHCSIEDTGFMVSIDILQLPRILTIICYLTNMLVSFSFQELLNNFKYSSFITKCLRRINEISMPTSSPHLQLNCMSIFGLVSSSKCSVI